MVGRSSAGMPEVGLRRAAPVAPLSAATAPPSSTMAPRLRAANTATSLRIRFPPAGAARPAVCEAPLTPELTTAEALARAAPRSPAGGGLWTAGSAAVRLSASRPGQRPLDKPTIAHLRGQRSREATGLLAAGACRMHRRRKHAEVGHGNAGP